LQVPICSFDAKNAILCPKCEEKLEAGQLSGADVEAAIKIAKLAKTNAEIDKFSLFACKQIVGNYVLYLAKSDIQTIRQSRTLYRTLQSEFPGKIWLVESEANDRKFIEDLFFPTKILSINVVWVPGGIQKTKVVVSGKWTAKFPIDVDKAANIVKELRQLDIIIEFEEGRGK
jgi:transcription antitermination factor NusA-like protein